MMRILRHTLAIAALALCGATPMAPVAKTVQVSIKGGFIPKSITINVRDSVTWRNTDTSDHDVTAIDGTFKSGNLKPGQTFTWTFRAAGVNQYECSLHPRETGTVTVQ
jgi:plastocyanin